MNNDYYEYFVERVREVIEKDKGRLSAFWINKVEGQPNTYCFQKLEGYSSSQAKYGKEILNQFISDFKNYLINDAPFKIVYKDFFPHSFLMGISEYLYNSYFKDDYLPRKDLNPTVEQFTKALKCFEDVIHTTFVLSLDVPQNMKNPNEYIKAIYSLNNQSYYEKLNEEDFREIVRGELDQLINNFSYEKDPVIKESLIIYVKNREVILEKFPKLQLMIFDQIKAIVHPDYWSDLANFLPVLNKKDSINQMSVFSLNTNPIYAIDLNINHIMSISSTIFTEQDFSKMISLITDSINLHKPTNIDFIETSEKNNKFKIFISGENLEQDKVMKIGNLFEFMIAEYNSDNVIKQSDYHMDDAANNKNKQYLHKAAEKHWLNLELDNNNQVKRKNKI